MAVGTHQGVSYCSFCQAVKELKMDGVISIELEYPAEREKVVEWVEEAYRETAKLMEQVGLRG